ncbi:hypothetical protein BX666DRAFT_2119500 [Dichotomocladium elegans]|nr:hypothetical protein BX666DRAFT_2119500 [Dichotomocladium elegans]
MPECNEIKKHQPLPPVRTSSFFSHPYPPLPYPKNRYITMETTRCCQQNQHSEEDDMGFEMASPACYRNILTNVNAYADDGFEKFFSQQSFDASSKNPMSLHQQQQQDSGVGPLADSASDNHPRAEASSPQPCSSDEQPPINSGSSDDDFGDFEGFGPSPVMPVVEDQDDGLFGSVEHALSRWKKTLAEVFPLPNLHEEWVMGSPLNIKQYVLEEAHESVHSRITWTSVTHVMDDDTGVPKVRWTHSKSEDLYLASLGCKRQETIAQAFPRLCIAEETEKDENTPTPPPTIAAEIPSVKDISEVHHQIAPSVKSFGLSSFAKFLPRLSTSTPRTSIPDPPTPLSTSSSTNRCSIDSQPWTSSANSDSTQHSSPASSTHPSPVFSSTKPVAGLHQQQSTIPSNDDHASVAESTRDKRHTLPPAINTLAANKSTMSKAPLTASLLDLDDDSEVFVSSPSASRSFFSFTPLSPTAAYHAANDKRHTLPLASWNLQPLVPKKHMPAPLQPVPIAVTPAPALQSTTGQAPPLYPTSFASSMVSFPQETVRDCDDDDFGDFVASNDVDADDDGWGGWSSA